MASTNVGNAYVTVSARFDKSWSSGVLTKANAVGDLISKGISKAMGAVSSSIDAAISRVDTMNNFPRIMENMGVGADAANAAISKLSKGIDGLPTALDTAVMGVERFTSKNGDVDKSADYFLALNDAILAGGASSELQASAVEQLSQSYAKGKMDMMEWRSLQQAMPAQINQIAKAMGKSADELGEGLRDGSISMDEFMDKIVELDKEGGEGFASFAEQAKTATGGIGTALTNVQNRVTKAVGSIIDSIGAENIAGAINSFSSHIADFAKPIIAFVDAFKGNFNFSAFMAELSPFGSVLESIGAKVMELAGNLGELFANVMTVGAPAFKLIGAVISGVFMAALNVVNSVAEGLNALFGEFDMMEMGWEKQSTAIAATGEELDGYVKVIEELAEKDNLTAGEQEKLRQAVEGYNRITGDSVEVTDAAKGALSKSTEEIKANAEAWKDNAYAQMYQQQVSDIIADSTRKQEKLTAATKKLIEYEQEWQDVLAHPELNPELYAQVSAERERLTQTCAELSEGIDDNNEKLSEAEERLGAADKSLLAYIESNVSLKQKLNDAGVSSTKFANYLTSIGKSEQDLANMSPEVVNSLINIAKASDTTGDQAGVALKSIASTASDVANMVTANFRPVPNKVSSSFASASTGATKNLNAIEQKSRVAAGNSSAAFNSLPSQLNSKFADAKGRSSGQLDGITAKARTTSSQSGSAFNSLPGAVGGNVSDAVSRARGAFEGVVSAAGSAQSRACSQFNGLGSRISSAIGSIHFPTPHVWYSEIDLLGLTTARVPHIEWYAKGGFVDGATLVGAGEKGREMILPESGGLMDSFSENLTKHVGNEDVIEWLGSNLGPIIEAFAPTATPRELRRMNTKVAAYA